MRFVWLSSFVLLGCRVGMAPGMLLGSLFLEVRQPQVISALCARPVPEAEVTRATSTELTIDQIAAERSLFGSEGHGTAHVEFKPEQGARCSGTVEFDFSQDSKIVRRTRRSVQHSNTFYYANVVVKRP